jgi:hypothetical protein
MSDEQRSSKAINGDAQTNYERAVQRVTLMASGDPAWDLSPADLTCLKVVLDALDALTEGARSRPGSPVHESAVDNRTEAALESESRPGPDQTKIAQYAGEMPTGWDLRVNADGSWFVEGPWFNTRQEARIAFFDLNRPPRMVTDPDWWKKCPWRTGMRAWVTDPNVLREWRGRFGTVKGILEHEVKLELDGDGRPEVWFSKSSVAPTVDRSRPGSGEPEKRTPCGVCDGYTTETTAWHRQGCPRWDALRSGSAQPACALRDAVERALRASGTTYVLDATPEEADDIVRAYEDSRCGSALVSSAVPPAPRTCSSCGHAKPVGSMGRCDECQSRVDDDDQRAAAPPSYRADMTRIATALGLADSVADVGHILGAIDEMRATDGAAPTAAIVDTDNVLDAIEAQRTERIRRAVAASPGVAAYARRMADERNEWEARHRELAGEVLGYAIDRGIPSTDARVAVDCIRQLRAGLNKRPALNADETAQASVVVAALDVALAGIVWLSTRTKTRRGYFGTKNRNPHRDAEASLIRAIRALPDGMAAPCARADQEKKT